MTLPQTEAELFEIAVNRYKRFLANTSNKDFHVTVTFDTHGYKEEAPEICMYQDYNRRIDGKNFRLVELEFWRSLRMKDALDTPSIAYQPVESTAIEEEHLIPQPDKY